MKSIKIEKSIKIPGTNIILEKGDKVRLKVTEAFAIGTAVNVARKMCSILSRRLGCEMNVCSIPSTATTSDGTYCIYYGYMKGKYNRIFSFDFFTGKADEIVGMSFYDDSARPSSVTERIDFNGFNIVQVLDQIVSFIDGSFEKLLTESIKEKYDRVKEKITLTDMAVSYLQDNQSYIPDINSGRFDYAGHIPEFLNYIAQKFNSRKSNFQVAAFQINVRNALSMNKSLGGNPNKVPAISVKSGIITKSSEPLLSADDQKIWDSLINLPATEVWEQYENYVRLIAQGAKSAISLIAYGTPGTGKTYNCKKILVEEGAMYHLIGAPIADTETIVGQIYLHKDNEVIVFDDIDAIFSSGNRNDMFKQLLDQKERRTTGTKKSFKVKDDMGNEQIVPPTFEVTSRIIVLSNKPKEYFDSAILSRVFSCALLFTKEDMLDLIESKLDKLGSKDFPSVSLDEKKYCFELLKRFAPKLPSIDLRVMVKSIQGFYLAKELFNYSGAQLDKQILLFIGIRN